MSLPSPRVLMASDFLVKYTASLAGGVAECGSPVTLLTRDHDLEFSGEPGAMRSFVEDALDGRGTHVELAGRIREVSGMRSTLAVRRRLRRFDADVVHLQDAILTDPRLIVAAGARPSRFALTVHDPSRHPGGNPARVRFESVRRWLIKRAGLIFVHAEALREELVELHRPSAPVAVVPHGVDPVVFEPLPARPSLLFFGRIMFYKGLDTLLDAMPEVWRRDPSVTLTVAGEGEVPAHPVLDDNRVTVWNGHVPEGEVGDLYVRSTCVVLPYRQASQSGVGSLAKRYGRAMIVTDVGGLPELLSSGGGLAVPPENPAALARAITDIVTYRQVAESMGRAGAASVEEGASWQQVARRTLEGYARHLGP